MTISGFKILSCPHCGQQYRDSIIGSFNTFKVRQYSDGFNSGGIPKQHLFIKCVNSGCRKFFWLKDTILIIEVFYKPFESVLKLSDDEKTEVKKRTVMSFEEAKEKYVDVCNLVHLKISVDDIEEALVNVFCQNINEELRLRILLLHHYNDVIRDNRNTDFAVDQIDKFFINLTQLSQLLSDTTNTNSQLLRAEVFRENGDFDMCEKLIEEIGLLNGYQEEFRRKIYSQSKLKNKRVFEIQRVAIRKEYKCKGCGDTRMLFDLDQLKSAFEYKCFKCIDCAAIFNTSTIQENPEPHYSLSLFQRMFKNKQTWNKFVPKDFFSCPSCKTTNTRIIHIEDEKCAKCNKENYKVVKWF